MFRYSAAATAYKAFSLNSGTQKIYRFIGNTLGSRMRERRGLTGEHMKRARKILDQCRRYEAVRDGSRLLEIGTGWVHWESTVLRMLYDVKIDLYDVWDCRQLTPYKRMVGEFGRRGGPAVFKSRRTRKRALEVMDAVRGSGSFEDIYEKLGFSYIIHPEGSLEGLDDDTYDLIYSHNVLEHVDRGILPTTVAEYHRVLKPGGLSIQHIDLRDHLSNYDRNAPVKNYLRYPDRVWKAFFESPMEYINRIQRPEWLKLFGDAGFSLVEEEVFHSDIAPTTPHSIYSGLDRNDLECVAIHVVHRK
jgi:SAM-dependent methyltransferase